MIGSVITGRPVSQQGWEFDEVLGGCDNCVPLAIEVSDGTCKKDDWVVDDDIEVNVFEVDEDDVVNGTNVVGIDCEDRTDEFGDVIEVDRWIWSGWFGELVPWRLFTALGVVALIADVVDEFGVDALGIFI